MPTKQDLQLAKRLLAARVVDEDTLRGAFEDLSWAEARDQEATLEDVLYSKGILPERALETLNEPSVLQAQPFVGYRVYQRIGDGGSSVVYRAEYVANGSPVALKVFDPVQALRPDFLARFREEARILIELEHENIVLGYELGYAGGRHFFSMDFVPGLTVLEIIDRRGHLENDEALSITLQAARALQYLHASGYLHRDIKPGNIMVDEAGRARLIDLGLIQALSESGGGGEETTTVGTVEYLSPEQARGRDDLDQRSDIYSLGVSLYHMVVGEVPFQGDDDYEVMAKQVLSELDTQKVKTRRITPEVHFFIKKMTSKDRDLRFRSVEETIQTIESYLPEGIVPVDFGAELEGTVPPVVAPTSPPTVAPVRGPPRVEPVVPPRARPVKPLKPPTAKPVAPPTAKPVKPPKPKPVKPPTLKPPTLKPVKPDATKPPTTKPPTTKPPTTKPPIAKPIRRKRGRRGGDESGGRRSRRRR